MLRIDKLIIQNPKVSTKIKVIIEGNVFIFDSKAQMKETLTDLAENKKHNQ